MLGMCERSVSLKACRASNGAPRQEASSNAIAVASSDAGEPTMPTRTGVRVGWWRDVRSSWMTATGQCAWWTNAVLTDPSNVRRHVFWPRLPTTTISADLDCSTSADADEETSTLVLIWGLLPPVALSSATLIARLSRCRARCSSCSEVAAESGAGSVSSIGGPTAGEASAWTRVRGDVTHCRLACGPSHSRHRRRRPVNAYHDS